MTRLLIILALVSTGFAPGATCLYAAAASSAAAATECEMVCCGPSCCCVSDHEPISTPDAPATPPRSLELVPAPLLLEQPFTAAWADPPAHVLLVAGYTPRESRRESRAVRPIICCWLT